MTLHPQVVYFGIAFMVVSLLVSSCLLLTRGHHAFMMRLRFIGAMTNISIACKANGATPASIANAVNDELTKAGE